MPTLTITDVDSRYDGSYPADDLFVLTLAERIKIREISKLYPADFTEAFWKSDAAVHIGFALVILARNGKHADAAPFLFADGDSIKWDFTAEEQEAEAEIPPGQPPNGGSEPASDIAPNGGETSSGSDSETSSETPTPLIPPGTGSPGSETTAEFAPVTSPA